MCIPEKIFEFTSVEECVVALAKSEVPVAVQAPGAVSWIWIPPIGDSAYEHAMQQFRNQCARYCSHRKVATG